MSIAGILWRNSLFTRLFATFLLLMIPIYIFAISFYIRGQNTVRNELLGSMDSRISFFLNNLNLEINNIKKLQYDFIGDDDLELITNMPESIGDIEKTFAIRRLQNRLDTIKGSSNLVQDASIYISSLNKVISAAGGSRQVIGDIASGEFEKLIKITLDVKTPFLFKDNRLSMYVAYPLTNSGNPIDVSYVVEVILSLSELKKMLKQVMGGTGDTCMLIENENLASIVSAANIEMPYEVRRSLKQQISQGRNSMNAFIIEGKKYWITFQVSKDINVTLLQYIAEDIIVSPLKRYQIWFWIFSGVALLFITFYSISTYKFIHKPMRKLVKAFSKLETGEMNVAITSQYKNEFGYLYRSFNTMVEKLRMLIDQIYIQKIHTQNAELKQLQSQINPHFLYNSFFILSSMAKMGDYDDLEIFAEQLGEYFQFITRNAAADVPLDKETQHARIYADIQAMRFSNRIKVVLGDLPSEFSQIPVPRLIIQPIIENAFEHSLEKKKKDGILEVKFFKENNDLQITVENSGDIMLESVLEKLSAGLLSEDGDLEVTGTLNIHRRLRLKYGNRAGLRFMHGTEGGLKVIITIPLS